MLTLVSNTLRIVSIKLELNFTIGCIALLKTLYRESAIIPKKNMIRDETNILKITFPLFPNSYVFILAEMYRRSGGTDTAVPVEVYRQTGTGYRLHHSG